MNSVSQLYMMFGYPGAGKTTTAKVIEELTGAVRLSSDEYRLRLFPQPNFSEQEHTQLYQSLNQETERLLLEGKSVIYDANLNRSVHRQEKYDICTRTNASPVLLWVKTPIELAKERAIQESRQHLVPKQETPEAMFDRIAEVIEAPGPNEAYIALDGTKVTPEYIADQLHLA